MLEFGSEGAIGAYNLRVQPPPSYSYDDRTPFGTFTTLCHRRPLACLEDLLHLPPFQKDNSHANILVHGSLHS